MDVVDMLLAAVAVTVAWGSQIVHMVHNDHSNVCTY